MPEIEAACELFLSTTERQVNRWYHEQQRLRKFPSFTLIRSGDTIVAAQGALTTQHSNTYEVRIALDGYPYGLPKVFPRNWTPHPASPHRYNDGSLCIMRSDQWRLHFTVALVVAKTAIWLGKYEIWKRNGHIWPGLGQRH